MDSKGIYHGKSYTISQLVEESIPLPIGITYELSVVKDNVIISLEDHLLIAVIDPVKGVMVDKFSGEDIYLDETNLIYKVGNLLASYDFKEKTMDVLMYTLSPRVLTVKDDMIIYAEGWGGNWYGTLPIGEDFIGETFKEEKDFYIFEFDNTGYLSELMLYDRKEKRITLLNGLVDLDYKLLPNSIRYERSGSTYQDETKWVDYPMPEGYTIGVLEGTRIE